MFQYIKNIFTKIKYNRTVRTMFYPVKILLLGMIKPPTKEQLEYCRDFRKSIPLMEFDGMLLKRIGGADTSCGKLSNDGGYLMHCPLSENRIAYSIGINDDVSWDDMTADMGYEVFMYDHTIYSLPHERKEFHWYKKGLASVSSENFMSLDDMLKSNGHSECSGMVLKIDIEDCEWEVFENLSEKTICRFDQIVIELHSLCRIDRKEKILSVLKKINSTHGAVHIHANNHGKLCYYGKYLMPDTIEVTYVLRDKFHLHMSNVSLPRREDMPNCVNVGEIILGRWNI